MITTRSGPGEYATPEGKKERRKPKRRKEKTAKKKKEEEKKLAVNFFLALDKPVGRDAFRKTPSNHQSRWSVNKVAVCWRPAPLVVEDRRPCRARKHPRFGRSGVKSQAFPTSVPSSAVFPSSALANEPGRITVAGGGRRERMLRREACQAYAKELASIINAARQT